MQEAMQSCHIFQAPSSNPLTWHLPGPEGGGLDNKRAKKGPCGVFHVRASERQNRCFGYSCKEPNAPHELRPNINFRQSVFLHLALWGPVLSASTCRPTSLFTCAGCFLGEAPATPAPRRGLDRQRKCRKHGAPPGPQRKANVELDSAKSRCSFLIGGPVYYSCSLKLPMELLQTTNYKAPKTHFIFCCWLTSLLWESNLAQTFTCPLGDAANGSNPQRGSFPDCENGVGGSRFKA